VESEGRQIETVLNKVQKIKKKSLLKNIAAGDVIQLTILRNCMQHRSGFAVLLGDQI
jgi:hypothetical protein